MDPLDVHNRINDSPAHDEKTSKDLKSSSEEEASALLKREKLAEKQQERQDTEDDGQDHEGLDRLNPYSRICRVAFRHLIYCGAVYPEIRAAGWVDNPCADYSGHEEQDERCDVQEDDSH